MVIKPRNWLSGTSTEGGRSYIRHTGGQHIRYISTATDSWWAYPREWLTTLDDFGLLESEWVNWDEVEDWEVRIPLRMAVTRDWLYEKNEPRWYPEFLDGQEIEDLDLVSPRMLADAYLDTWVNASLCSTAGSRSRTSR